MEQQEQLSNGGMLYHEVQESKLCAVHCVNTVLQGPFFSEFDLAALASDLDRSERQVLAQGHVAQQDQSHNVSLDGDFSIQVLQKAMEVWDLQIIPLNSPEAGPAQVEPELENAFICHLQDHWFCIRKVNGEWYNFNSLYPAPEHLSKFYLSAYLATLKSSGWSIFIVRGNFPRECPIASTEGSNGYGQWLLPEDAERITKSCNNAQRQQPHITSRREQIINQFSPYEEDEDEDLNAAIAASLMDSSLGKASVEAVTLLDEVKNKSLAIPSPGIASSEAATSLDEGKNKSLAVPSPGIASSEAATSLDEVKNKSLAVPSLGIASSEAATSKVEMEKNNVTESSSGAAVDESGAQKDEKKIKDESNV